MPNFPSRHLSLFDKSIVMFDRALRSLSSNTQPAGRATPTPKNNEATALTEKEKRISAGYMRVNHTGEVCAQALYQGQALTAKLPEVRKEMEIAADEEIDHLAWCEQRLKELGSHTSLINPLWYGLSFTIGAAAGMVSDKLSLGFVNATEDQVCAHLNSHLQKLPKNDVQSRTIVSQMLIDEEKHAYMALNAGGYHFPMPVKRLMTVASKFMTFSSYRI